MAQCTLGSGVNKEYFPEASESFSVCSDCIWKWVQFLSSGPSKVLPLHQKAALAIMSTNASSFLVLHNNPRNFIKHFLRCNSASGISLIHALQGHRAFRSPSLTVATEKIDGLIRCGNIEVHHGICRWNDKPALSSPSTSGELPPPSVTASRKRTLFSV